MLNNEGKLVDEAALRSGSKEAKDSLKFTTSERSFRVILDANQYKLDMDNLKSNKINEDVYATFNVFVRRRPKENNFKAILESIRDLMNINFVVPPWLHDLLLGYGSPASAAYYNLKEPKPTSALDFRCVI
jgi:intron-binding protein aquarius